MDDALLVSRAIGGDLDSFGQLYDRYFNRIYDFCWRITRDADEAADATQDVFVKAMQALPGLSRAASFKSWIFTIAHNTAVTRAERAGRTSPLPVPSADEAFGTFDVPDPSRLDNPALVAEDHELAGLVWEAASALNPRDYALLDLHVRQGLESAEIAQVMSVSKGNAYTMVSRMKSAAGDVISSYVVARRGSKDCEALRGVLSPYEFPPFSDEVRRAVDAHVRDCEVCQRSRKSLLAPLEIFGSFAAVPAPFALKGDIWRDLSSQWPWTGTSAVTAASRSDREGDRARDSAIAAAAGAAGGGGGGFALSPAHAGGGDGGNRIVLFAVAVLGMVVFAFALAGGVILAGRGGGDGDGGASDATAAVRTATTPGVVVETPTPDLTASVTPTPETATATPTPREDTATPEPTLPPTTSEPPTVAPATPTPDEPAASPTAQRSPGLNFPTLTPTPPPIEPQ